MENIIYSLNVIKKYLNRRINLRLFFCPKKKYFFLCTIIYIVEYKRNQVVLDFVAVA